MSKINFMPFPALETRRLRLRAITKDDAPVMFTLRSNPDTMKYVPRPLHTDMQAALDQITMINDKIEKNEGINWAITFRDNDQLIGIIGHYRIQPENFRSEVGYMLLPEFAGRGIITEALHEALRYGFDNMGLNSIEAVIDPENTASERILLKYGFIREAILRENVFFEGKFLDSMIYSLLSRNFDRNRLK